MALEFHRLGTAWVYRIDPYRGDRHDDRHPYGTLTGGTSIQRRRLTRGARWEHFMNCETAQMAREVILVMQEDPYR
jgi:hypothetical protein